MWFLVTAQTMDIHMASSVSTSHGPQHGLWWPYRPWTSTHPLPQSLSWPLVAAQATNISMASGAEATDIHKLVCVLFVCLFFPQETQPLAHQGAMYKTVRIDSLKPPHSKAQDSCCIPSKTSHRPPATQENGNKPHLCMGLHKASSQGPCRMKNTSPLSRLLPHKDSSVHYSSYRQIDP